MLDPTLGKEDMQQGSSGFVGRSRHFEQNKPSYEHIGTLASGHKVWHHTETKHGEYSGKKFVNHNFIVTHPKTDKVSMSLSTHEPQWANNDKRKDRPKTHVIGVAAKNAYNPDRSLKAHKLYHHLITKHNMMLVSSHQSYSNDNPDAGGSGIWNRLAKEKDVGMHVHEKMNPEKPKKKPKSINAKVSDEEGGKDHETYGKYADVDRHLDSPSMSQRERGKIMADLEELHPNEPDSYLVAYPKVKDKS